VPSLNTSVMSPNSAIFIAGHRGLVGSAIERGLRRAGFCNLILRDHSALDLRDQVGVRDLFAQTRPAIVFLAAGRVGGIFANNSYPAEFLMDNLAIQTNVIDAAYRFGARKLLFLGSSCIYPKHAPQPISEDDLLSGPLEPTNEWYAIAKIAGLKMCQAYRRQYGFDAIAVMPTNLYGAGDNFSLRDCHVLPALIRKIHDAKINHAPNVEIWGTGKPRREFMHVDDLADACLYLMHEHSGEQLINIGTGDEVSIGDLATLIADIVGYHGEMTFNTSMPDGTPRKLLDVSRLRALGWTARIPLREGLTSTYEWFTRNVHNLRDAPTQESAPRKTLEVTDVEPLGWAANVPLTAGIAPIGAAS
jgi:GDP-L-fucose synthase